MPRSSSFSFLFVLLVVALVALAPRETAIEEDIPLAAPGSTEDSLGKSRAYRPDAASFPVPCPFPGEGR